MTKKKDPAHQSESEVRSYCRSYPVIFDEAKGAVIKDSEGNEYIDFLSGAGTLNYGHNNPVIKEAVIEHIEQDKLIHGLDMATKTKNEFIEIFKTKILQPRSLNYKIQFSGPTGTNAVEAALKLARKITGRTGIVSFTRGFHGMTAGALAATANSYFKKEIKNSSKDVTFMPYDNYFGSKIDTAEILEQYLTDPSSGLEKPAALILETIQGEGGLNVASPQWLRKITSICKEHRIVFIVDDIQVGCGRTGNFFSFEEAKIEPDIVLLSKSLGAYGLPMSLVLIKPELDIWQPAEHNGTFRGNNLAFKASAKAIEVYWSNSKFSEEIFSKSKLCLNYLQGLVNKFKLAKLKIKGKGLALGLESSNAKLSSKIKQACFERKLIIETSGPNDEVLKILPPLTINEDKLLKGLEIIQEAISEALKDNVVEIKTSLKIGT